MPVSAGKVCFVPSCVNTSQNAPAKIFLHVPQNHHRRIRWFQSVRLLRLSKRHALYCCEDHFNLEEDCENWMFFKTMGRKLMLKKHVVPHRNLVTSNIPQTESQLCSSDKKRKFKVIENMKNKRLLKNVVKVKYKNTFTSASRRDSRGLQRLNTNHIALSEKRANLH